MAKNRKRKKERRDQREREALKAETADNDDDADAVVASRPLPINAVASATVPVASPVGNETNDNSGAESSKKKKRRKESKKSSKKKQKRAQDAAAVKSEPVQQKETPTEPLEIIEIIQEPAFPFPTTPDDHCESPQESYKHILPLLKSLGGKDPSKLRIYDPYYCDGAVKQNLKDLGFPRVHNEKEDCYQAWSNPKDYPEHDVLVTNPPYSGDHMAKLVEHITSPQFGNRPWFLLLPTWVHKHEYFVKGTRNIRPFYLVPRKRYVYVPPKDFRQAKKSDVHKKSSPFVSMWFVWGGDAARNEQLMRQFTKSANGNPPTCDLARSKSGLRDLRRKKR